MIRVKGKEYSFMGNNSNIEIFTSLLIGGLFLKEKKLFPEGGRKFFSSVIVAPILNGMLVLGKQIPVYKSSFPLKNGWKILVRHF